MKPFPKIKKFIIGVLIFVVGCAHTASSPSISSTVDPITLKEQNQYPQPIAAIDHWIKRIFW